ncbi:pre-tRNA nuclear export protein, partial [Neophaeococcomyces mojaviensis]
SQLMTYLEREYTSARNGILSAPNQFTPPPAGVTSAPDSSTIENKIAQTITSIFCALYDSLWPTFFDDLLTLTTATPGRRDNLIGVAFYLRVVNSVHDEIGDQLQARSREEQDRANTLKDLVRARDVNKIAQAWQEILSQWGITQGTLGELSMMGISKWVSWIDISLIVNQPMLQLISQQVEQKSVSDLKYEEERARDTAIEALTEIVSKKMSSTDKINMIEFIGVQAIVEKLSAWPILFNTKNSAYDVDLAEYVAKLINAAVLDIVRALENEKQDSETWRKAENMLRSFLPDLLRYFSDDYDDVCSHVLPAMTDVLTFLRKAFQGDEFVSQRTAILLPILQAIFSKSRVDEYADFDGEYDGDNTEEAEFLELRKKLSNLQSSIAATDEQLYIDAVSALVNSTFEGLQTKGQQLNWRDLDLALHEMYLLGDLAVKSGGLYQKNKPNSPAAERLVRMMLLMVQSNTGNYPVPGIQVQYMEICVRYSSFFEKHSEFIPAVLQNFLHLAHSNNLRVKLRSWYLLQRFVKQQRHNVGPVADSIVPNLQDLLAIRAEVPQSSEDDDSDEEASDSTFNSQLYLYETIGCIISTSNVPPDKQIQYARIVMQPIFTDIQNNLNLAKSNKQACLQVHHDIMALGNIARGYFDWQGTNTFAAANNVPGPIKEAFAQVSEVTLVALETLKASPDIRSAARFTFTRLLGMVGQQMLPQLPRWVDNLLTESSSRDEMAQLLRLLDQVTFGFKNDVFDFLDALLGGLLQRVWAGISASPTGTDDEVELAELKREYLNFFLVVLGNGLGGVLVSTTNQPHFETILTTIEHFTKDISDLTTAKMAFQLLARMCLVWGGADVVQGQTPTDVTQTGQLELPGFKQFVMTRFSPLCWSMPQNPSFNPKDGQSRQVLMEAAGLQKTIYAKNGQEYINYLQTTELPGLGLQVSMMQDFLRKLTSMALKDWKSWFAKFVSTGGAA